jgi:hypothetical protein
MANVSIHARDRATAHGRAYVSPVLDYPSEGGGFQPELVFDEIILEQRRLARREKSKRDAELLQLHVLAVNAMTGSRSQHVRERALSWVDTWEKEALCSPCYITKWRYILNLPASELHQAMLRPDAEGVALRQNTPFGFLKRSCNGQE